MGNEFCSTNNFEPEEMKISKKNIHSYQKTCENNPNFSKINFKTNRLKEHKEVLENLSEDEFDDNINDNTKKKNELNLKNSFKNYFNQKSVNDKKIYDYKDKNEQANEFIWNNSQNNNSNLNNNIFISFAKNQNNLNEKN